MDRNTFTPVIICLSNQKEFHRNNKAWFEELGIDIIEYTYSKWDLQLHFAAIASKIQRDFNHPDILFHAHGYYPTLILSKMKEARAITTIHNICEQDFRMTKGLLMGTYMAYCYKKALKDIGLCVTICNTMQSHYVKDKSLNITTVYNGVEVNETTADYDRDTLRKKMGITSDQKVLFYPAAFSHRKNQRRIIQELKKRKDNDFVVLFAGEGALMHECRQLANNDARFRFLGYQMDMKPYWAICDFMLSSSYSEGLPMAVLEALVQGIPCILSDIPPHREILSHIFPVEELCFDLGTPQALNELINKVLHRDFQRKQIKRIALGLYSAKVMAQNYENIYKDFICSPNTPFLSTSKSLRVE